MFGLFSKKSEKEKLQSKYEKLMQESFELSTSNRSQSDAKAAEAEKLAKRNEIFKAENIEKYPNAQQTESGLMYIHTVVGEGEFPKKGDPMSGWVHVSWSQTNNRKQAFTIG